MKILAIDTSTEACSAAVYVDGDTFQRYRVAPQQHSDLILDFCDEVLAEAGISLEQIDTLAFGRGPGSFTGIRIATGVVQGIAIAKNLPVIPISTLAAMAFGVHKRTKAEHIFTAIDARMQEIYWGAYYCNGVTAHTIGNEHVSAPSSVILSNDQAWLCAGTGWEKYANVIRSSTPTSLVDFADVLYPEAIDIALLAAHEFKNGNTVSAADALPVYLRDRVTYTVAT